MAIPKRLGNTKIVGNLTVTGDVTVSGTTTAATSAVTDSTFLISDNVDTTKKVAFQVSGVTTGTTRTLTIPDANDTIAGLAATQTFTNKTITSPVLSGSATGTYTLAGTPTITAPAITIADDVALTLGTTAGSVSTVKVNTTRKALEVGSLGVGVDVLSPLVSDRFKLQEYFERAPQLSAVTQAPAADTYTTAALLLHLNSNRNFEVLGTNAVSADVTQYVEGGIAVATHGATNDSTIILPHLTATQSPWTKVTWGSDQSTRWECCLETPAAVTSCVIWAGLKLTNTPTVATDNDQAFFILDTAAGADATKWHTVYSIGGTDTDAGVGSAVAAATKYKLAIDINSSRIAKFYIDGTLVTTSTALTNATDFIPYVGIKDLSAGSARILYLFSEAISRKPGVA